MPHRAFPRSHPLAEQAARIFAAASFVLIFAVITPEKEQILPRYLANAAFIRSKLQSRLDLAIRQVPLDY